MQTAKCLIGFGSNKALGEQSPQQNVRRAFVALSRILGEGDFSPLYRSEAWPDPSGPDYVNAVARFSVHHSPHAVMAALLAVEAGFSRQRSEDVAERYAPRTLDLDLLDFDSLTIATDHLTLPHPRLDVRAFVLIPLRDVEPDWRHPRDGKTVDELLSMVDRGGVERIDEKSV